MQSISLRIYTVAPHFPQKLNSAACACLSNVVYTVKPPRAEPSSPQLDIWKELHLCGDVRLDNSHLAKFANQLPLRPCEQQQAADNRIRVHWLWRSLNVRLCTPMSTCFDSSCLERTFLEELSCFVHKTLGICCSFVAFLDVVGISGRHWMTRTGAPRSG